MKRALYDRLRNFGNQYNVGSQSCFSLMITANLAVISIEWVVTINLSSVEIRSSVLVRPSSCIRVLI